MLVKALGSAFGGEDKEDEDRFEQNEFLYLNDPWLKRQLPNDLTPDSQ